MKRFGLWALLALAPLSAAAVPEGGKSDPQGLYLEGLVQERFGRPVDALAFYRRAAELDPSSRFLQETLAELCLRLGRPDEALEAARRVAALPGPVPAAQVLIGRVSLARGDRAAAGRAFEVALSSDPAYGEALIYSAFLRSSDDPAKAAGFLERYLKENPGSVEALTRLATLSESLKDFDKAEELWRRAQEKAPMDPDIHVSLARLAESKGDRAGALAEYETARFLEPRNVEVLVPLGETYFRLGRAAEAKATLGEALRLAPDDAAVRFGLALLAEDEGDWLGAAAQMAYVARDSDRPEVVLHLAQLQSMAGRPAEALKTLQRFQRRSPPSADLWFAMGLAREDLGHRRRALSCFLKAAAIDPSRADARFHAAVVLDVLGRFPDAQSQLLKAIELDPKNATALNYLGYSWADRGIRLDEALSLIRRAVALEPDNAAFLDSLGWCLFKLGRRPEAESVLARAVHGEEEPAIWEHYGDVLKALGREEEAVRAWQEGYLLDPKSRSLGKRLGGKGQASHVTPLSAPRALLKRVEGIFRPLRGFAGGAAVTARRSGFSASIDGIFYYRAPRFFRVEVLGGFMAPTAVVVSNADGVHVYAPDGAAPALPGSGAWFDLLGDVFSGALTRRFDDPSVRVEQEGSDLIYTSKGESLRIDGRRKALTRVESGGVVLRFGDYREVDGFALPGTVRADLADGTSLSISFRKLRVNPDLGDALFATPGGAR